MKWRRYPIWRGLHGWIRWHEELSSAQLYKMSQTAQIITRLPLRPLMPETQERSLSPPSLNSLPEDDWDRSLPDSKDNAATTTPIVFPVNEKSGESTPSKNASVHQDTINGKGNLALSELLRLHSEKDSKGNISEEEAARIADVLGQWVGVHSCPVLKLDPDSV